MKIVNINNVEEREGGAPLFFGGRVTTQFALVEEWGAGNISVVNVKFAPGARNKLHTHTTEQILYVTEGEGIVATRDEEHTVGPGTVVFIPSDEEHWHGATRDSSFAHLSIISPPPDMPTPGK